jgi:hypothetical protein
MFGHEPVLVFESLLGGLVSAPPFGLLGRPARAARLPVRVQVLLILQEQTSCRCFRFGTSIFGDPVVILSFCCQEGDVTESIVRR